MLLFALPSGICPTDIRGVFQHVYTTLLVVVDHLSGRFAKMTRDIVNVDLLGRETDQNALRTVSNMLQRADQLEKIEQIKKRVKRNIVSLVCSSNLLPNL